MKSSLGPFFASPFLFAAVQSTDPECVVRTHVRFAHGDASISRKRSLLFASATSTIDARPEPSEGNNARSVQSTGRAVISKWSWVIKVRRNR